MALMALFFLLVGLEIKRELVRATCRRPRRSPHRRWRALGGMAAAGPDLCCHQPERSSTPEGVGHSAATDIAFALGVLALTRQPRAGSR